MPIKLAVLCYEWSSAEITCHLRPSGQWVRRSFSRSAPYGSVVLLTAGIYKKWSDTSNGCKAAAHAKSYADVERWINPESHKVPCVMGDFCAPNQSNASLYAHSALMRNNIMLLCRYSSLLSAWWWIKRSAWPSHLENSFAFHQTCKICQWKDK